LRTSDILSLKRWDLLKSFEGNVLDQQKNIVGWMPRAAALGLLLAKSDRRR